MSNASEVKRWWVSIQDQDGRIVRRDVERLCLAGPEPEPEGYEVFIEVMPVEDHDRIVADLKAEVEVLKNHRAEYEADCKRVEYFNDLHDKAARQAKVIEKLREQRNIENGAKWNARGLGTVSGISEIEKMDAQIAAIKQGEGT